VFPGEWLEGNHTAIELVCPVVMRPVCRDAEPVGAGLPAITPWQAIPIYLTPQDPTVGAGLPAITPWQAIPIYLTPHNPTVGDSMV